MIQHPGREFAIGRRQQLDGAETGLMENRAQLGEGQEPLVAVVMPHAAGAYAAEGKIVLAHM